MGSCGDGCGLRWLFENHHQTWCNRMTTILHAAMYFDGDEVLELDCPAVTDVLSWIRRLDGAERTIVAVTLDNAMVRRLRVEARIASKSHARIGRLLHNLASGLTDSYERVPLVVGEDLCYYPKKYIVTLDQALRATSHFCTTGELLPELQWSSAEDYYPFEPEVRARDEPPRELQRGSG